MWYEYYALADGLPALQMSESVVKKNNVGRFLATKSALRKQTKKMMPSFVDMWIRVDHFRNLPNITAFTLQTSRRQQRTTVAEYRC